MFRSVTISEIPQYESPHRVFGCRRPRKQTFLTCGLNMSHSHRRRGTASLQEGTKMANKRREASMVENASSSDALLMPGLSSSGVSTLRMSIGIERQAALAHEEGGIMVALADAGEVMPRPLRPMVPIHRSAIKRTRAEPASRASLARRPCAPTGLRALPLRWSTCRCPSLWG